MALIFQTAAFENKGSGRWEVFGEGWCRSSAGYNTVFTASAVVGVGGVQAGSLALGHGSFSGIYASHFLPRLCVGAGL